LVYEKKVKGEEEHGDMNMFKSPKCDDNPALPMTAGLFFFVF